jgi:hypothetical protein
MEMTHASRSWNNTRNGEGKTQPLPSTTFNVLATYLEWERQDFAEAIPGIRHGHEDVKAGRARPAAGFLADLRRKHDLPR